MSAYIECLLKLMMRLDINIHRQLNNFSEFSKENEGIAGLIQALHNYDLNITSSNIKSYENLDEDEVKEEESKNFGPINIEEIHKNSEIVLEQVKDKNSKLNFEEDSNHSTIFNFVLNQIGLMDIK